MVFLLPMTLTASNSLSGFTCSHFDHAFGFPEQYKSLFYSNFQAIFGPCLQITTHYFLTFSVRVAYLTIVLVSEIKPLQCRVLQ
jgi:hypothetical protein